MTAYRQQALAYAALLSAGPSSPKDLRTVARMAVRILLRNVYGGFERTERGVYQLPADGGRTRVWSMPRMRWHFLPRWRSRKARSAPLIAMESYPALTEEAERMARQPRRRYRVTGHTTRPDYQPRGSVHYTSGQTSSGQTSETFSQAISRCSVTPSTTRGGGIRIMNPFSNRTPRGCFVPIRPGSGAASTVVTSCLPSYVYAHSSPHFFDGIKNRVTMGAVSKKSRGQCGWSILANSPRQFPRPPLASKSASLQLQFGR